MCCKHGVPCYAKVASVGDCYLVALAHESLFLTTEASGNAHHFDRRGFGEHTCSEMRIARMFTSAHTSRHPRNLDT